MPIGIGWEDSSPSVLADSGSLKEPWSSRKARPEGVCINGGRGFDEVVLAGSGGWSGIPASSIAHSACG